jgi:predicted dehydrogenase
VIVQNLGKKPDMDCRVVCDVNERRARKVGDENGVPWSTSYEEVLERHDLEAVLLYTPPHLHAEHIRMAADAGKGVRVTKPLERSSKAASAALRYAEERGIIVVADSPPPRYTGMYRLFRDLIESGDLGKVVTAHTYTGSFYDNVHPDGTWYDDPQLCPGGPIYRLGIYGINMFNVLLGKPRLVTATQSWVRSTRPTPDTGSVTIVYANGATVNVVNSLSWGGSAYPDTTIVWGTEGMLIHNATFEGLGGGKPTTLLRTKKEVRELKPGKTAGAVSEDRYFATLVREGGPPEISPSHAVDSVRVVEAVSRSLEEGKTVELEPLSEKKSE